MQDILRLTAAAKKHLSQQLSQQREKSHFRLGVKRTGCSGWMYVPELIVQADETDRFVTEFDGVRVYVQSESIDIIQGTTVDYVDKRMGLKQMEFANPNATSLCGCGESFQLASDKDGD